MDNFKVNILLASYNGEKYIEKQIDSIINQTCKNWKLIIRDDGSTDNTVALIKAFEVREKRIELLVDGTKNEGAFNNFLRLTEYANSKYSPDYILYSDQDDFWFEDKVDTLVQVMIRYENTRNDIPILIHSNYQFTDEILTPLNVRNVRSNMSKMKRMALFNNLVFQNNIYGCTSIVNKNLIVKSLEDVIICENHDQWMAMNASWYGKIFYHNEKLMLYRQHSSNVSGSYLNRKSYFKKIFSINSVLKDEIISLKRSLFYLNHFVKKKHKNNVDMQLGTNKEIEVSKRLIWFCLRNNITKNSIPETILFYLTLFYSWIKSFRIGKGIVI